MNTRQRKAQRNEADQFIKFEAETLAARKWIIHND